jgi:hypothetical protein
MKRYGLNKVDAIPNYDTVLGMPPLDGHWVYAGTPWWGTWLLPNERSICENREGVLLLTWEEF